jgi:uncharacterized protein (TIGR02246 family)
MKPAILPALLPIAVLAACTPPGAPDPAAVLAEIAKVEAAQMAAMEAGNVAGAIAPYAADAVMVSPGAAPAGGDAIRRNFEALAADPGFGLSVTRGPAWVAASGELAVTSFTAQYTFTDPVSRRPVTEPMGNQTVWQKDADGAWKIVSDYNVSLPVPAQRAPAAR